MSAGDVAARPRRFRQMLKTMHHGGSIAMLGIPPADTGSIGTR